jgi:hypothetical protein
MVDVEAIRTRVDQDTMNQMATQCRTWFTVEVKRHEERVTLGHEWLEHGDGRRGYVYAPKVEQEDVSILEARVETLGVESIVRAIYGTGP